MTEREQLARELQQLSEGGAANLNDFGLFVVRNMSAIMAALRPIDADMPRQRFDAPFEPAEPTQDEADVDLLSDAVIRHIAESKDVGTCRQRIKNAIAAMRGEGK